MVYSFSVLADGLRVPVAATKAINRNAAVTQNCFWFRFIVSISIQRVWEQGARCWTRDAAPEYILTDMFLRVEQFSVTVEGNCDTNDAVGARVSVLTTHNHLIHVTWSMYRCLRAINRLKFASQLQVTRKFDSCHMDASGRGIAGRVVARF